MAGQTFGGKATSFDYRNIMGVEVRTGFASGDLELIVGGLATPRGKAKVKANEAPNAISFASVEQKLFQSMATQIRMMSGQPLAVAPQDRANPQGLFRSRLGSSRNCMQPGFSRMLNFQRRKPSF